MTETTTHSPAHDEVGTPEFEAALAELRAAVRDPRHGFAGPGSASWRVNREIALHAAGPRALLMQFAHPLVAQGVADHSHFQRDLFGRTVRTFSAVYALVFGPCDAASRAARQIHRVHKRVRGALPHDAGAYHAGTPYAANDPALLAWVWATLIDSALYAHDALVRPLVGPERDGYYAEARRLGRLFGLAHDALPPDPTAFARWFDAEVASDRIAVSPTAYRIGRVFLEGRTGPRSLAPFFRLLAAGTLPPKLRDGFGLPWDRTTRVGFNALWSSIRAGRRVLPPTLRAIPQALAADWRCRDAHGTPAP